MAYNHGVHVSEVPTSILPPVQVAAGIPMIIGTAPINQADLANVNKPQLCYSYAEAVEKFGFAPAKAGVGGLKKFAFSISEFIYSQFALFGVAPVIIVNVLDPAKHTSSVTTVSVTLNASTGAATVEEEGILPGSVVLKHGDNTYALDTDYTLAFDDDGYLVITSIKGASGFKVPVGEALSLTASKLDPSKVTSADVIGGVSADGATKKGLELIHECFPRFRLTPGVLLAPGFSGDPEVAAVMAAKADNINEHFRCIALVDVPTETVDAYSGVAEWKNNNNVVDPLQVVCWPMLSLSGTVFHFSTQLAGLIGRTDGENSDVPYVSPSNKTLQMTAAVTASGKEVVLGPDTAAYLNGQGIVTALNFIGGWVCWGNRTAAYPGKTDVKDTFIPLKRMFAWVGNVLIQTYWQRVDYPLNRRQVETIVDSANIWLNGLAARQFILGGRVEFLESENPTTDLMDGIARFHVYITPPSPNREIEFILEYDPQYLETLFG